MVSFMKRHFPDQTVKEDRIKEVMNPAAAKAALDHCWRCCFGVELLGTTAVEAGDGSPVGIFRCVIWRTVKEHRMH